MQGAQLTQKAQKSIKAGLQHDPRAWVPEEDHETQAVNSTVRSCWPLWHPRGHFQQVARGAKNRTLAWQREDQQSEIQFNTMIT